MSPRPATPTWYLLVVILLTSLSLAAANVWYTQRIANRADQRWCAQVSAQAAVYREVPPQTATGRRLAQANADRLAELRCPPG